MQYSSPQNPNSQRIEIGFLHMHAPFDNLSVTAKMESHKKFSDSSLYTKKFIKTWLDNMKLHKCASDT
jgi:hypothetical protein